MSSAAIEPAGSSITSTSDQKISCNISAKEEKFNTENFKLFKHFCTSNRTDITVTSNALEFKISTGSYGIISMYYITYPIDKLLIEKKFIFYDKDIEKIDREIGILLLLKDYCGSYIVCLEGVDNIYKEGDKYIAKIYYKFEGFSLDSYLFDNRKSFNNIDYLIVMNRLLDGLAFINEKGFVHRDIKPSNIIINPNTLIVKYIDFGASCVINAESHPSFKNLMEDYRFAVEQTNACLMENMVGTPLYFSPEITQDKNLSFEGWVKSDIWALGVTFFWLVTGILPFNSTHILNLTMLINTHDITIDKIKPESESQKELLNLTFPYIKSMLSKNPDNRPSIGYLATSFRQILYTQLTGKTVFDIDDFKLQVVSYISKREKTVYIDSKTKILRESTRLNKSAILTLDEKADIKKITRLI